MHKHIKEEGKIMEENSRRSFFKRAAALGVVAAAAGTKTLISRTIEPDVVMEIAYYVVSATGPGALPRA